MELNESTTHKVWFLHHRQGSRCIFFLGCICWVSILVLVWRRNKLTPTKWYVYLASFLIGCIFSGLYSTRHAYFFIDCLAISSTLNNVPTTSIQKQLMFFSFPLCFSVEYLQFPSLKQQVLVDAQSFWHI